MLTNHRLGSLLNSRRMQCCGASKIALFLNDFMAFSCHFSGFEKGFWRVAGQVSGSLELNLAGVRVALAWAAAEYSWWATDLLVVVYSAPEPVCYLSGELEPASVWEWVAACSSLVPVLLATVYSAMYLVCLLEALGSVGGLWMSFHYIAGKPEVLEYLGVLAQDGWPLVPIVLKPSDCGFQWAKFDRNLLARQRGLAVHS